MNAGLPLFKNAKHNSESASTLAVTEELCCTYNAANFTFSTDTNAFDHG